MVVISCIARKGHLDGDDATKFVTAEALSRSLPELAGESNCAMIVLKEFPARYRAPLQCLRHAGFTRVPGMPMTTLNIDYRNFDDYLSNMLSPRTRGKVRRKLRAAARAQPAISMSVVTDVTPHIDAVYPLYEKVFERSPLQFEKLTREFLCEIGRRIPDKVRFSIWRQESHIIAFGLCTMQGDNLAHDYVVELIGYFTTSSNGPSRTATSVFTVAASTTIQSGICATRSTLSTSRSTHC